MARQLSGLQREVLAFYRQALRAAKAKEKASDKGAGTVAWARDTFRAAAHRLSTHDFKLIEHNLRQGRKQLKMLSKPDVQAAHKVTIDRDMKCSTLPQSFLHGPCRCYCNVHCLLMVVPCRLLFDCYVSFIMGQTRQWIGGEVAPFLRVVSCSMYTSIHLDGLFHFLLPEVWVKRAIQITLGDKAI
ncbi:hypothetical protein JKP88DRAFT_205627 [Tribonema minus]|uniref:Complex 1 LYR protein domain-containing protein n=1 Tax=Tribonema minus TaxID=303371 RepID=A0A835ZGL7_9STRA|nr:hypothetical protein JKP88DRAFT_205627 [Tribonema minus]